MQNTSHAVMAQRREPRDGAAAPVPQSADGLAATGGTARVFNP